MKTIITATAALALLGACATPPSPICDREAQVWNKFETQEDICETVATPVRPAHKLPNFNRDRPKRPTESVEVPEPTDPTPTPPVTPPTPPVVTPPEDEDKPKGDNSDANGKGGNKHDREDFTHGGTETAEDKKD